MERTEVQRLGRELENVGADALRRRFQSAARADVKLACALRGYFTLGEECYLPYIRSRIRPAGTELVLAGRTAELARLEALGLLSEALTEELLTLAIGAGIPESIIWLLKRKERCFGFAPRELEL